MESLFWLQVKRPLRVWNLRDGFPVLICYDYLKVGKNVRYCPTVPVNNQDQTQVSLQDYSAKINGS